MKRRGRGGAGGRGSGGGAAGGPGDARGPADPLRSGGRQLHRPLRTARGRSLSSQRWLERQINDPYVAEARARGYRSRAAFKLLQLDERLGLFRPGQRVVDLGAAPGGWSQVAAAAVGAEGTEAAGAGRVVALDLLAMEPLPGVTCLQLDFLAEEAPERLRQVLGGPADLVLSDLAPAATGHAKTDHLRIVALAEAALDFAREVLAPGGHFVAKVLQGGSERTLLETLRRSFAKVRHLKPPASRADSAELYVVALGFRGLHSHQPERRPPA